MNSNRQFLRIRRSSVIAEAIDRILECIIVCKRFIPSHIHLIFAIMLKFHIAMQISRRPVISSLVTDFFTNIIIQLCFVICSRMLQKFITISKFFNMETITVFIRIRCISSQFFIQFIQQIHSLHFDELLELAFFTFNLSLNTFIILHLLTVSIEFLRKGTLNTSQNIFELICANPLVVETKMIIILLRSPIAFSIKTIMHIIRFLRRIEFNRIIAKFTSDDQFTLSAIEIGLTNNHISSFICSWIKRNTNVDFTFEKARRTIFLLCTCRVIRRN